ncbi:MAG: uroporphyrinogen-III synthase, partial [Acidimicrobiales bacterium]
MSRPGPTTEELPLTGFTVAVTSDRRSEELTSMFIRRGARVVTAPMIRLDLMADDRELHIATKLCMATPADVVVVTTGIGFRKWVEAVDGWGMRDDFLAWLSDAELVARGPKVRGSIRAAGLVEAWAPVSEAMAEVLERLLIRGVEGRRIVIQLHGDPLQGVVDKLEAAGAEVTAVPVYQLG